MANVTASVVTMEAQLIAVSNVYMRGLGSGEGSRGKVGRSQGGKSGRSQGGKWGGVKGVSGEESRG